MSKIEPLVDVGSLANTVVARAVINANSQRIEDAFQNTLSRDGSLPNQMEADIDLNGNYLLNVADASSDSDGVNLRQVQLIVADAFNGADPGLRVDLANADGSDLVTYTPPSTGIPDDLTTYLDTLDAAGAATLRAELAATPSGAGLVSFMQSGTGAVARTVLEKLRERVSVLDYIPVEEHAAIKAGTSTYNSWAGINAAMASLGSRGGIVYFPAGTYEIFTGPLVIFNPGITFQGENRYRTKISQNTLNVGVLQITSTAQNTNVNDLSFGYTGGNPTAGIAVDAQGTYSQFRDITISECFTGFKFSVGAGQKLSHFEVLEYKNIGVWCDAINDIIIDSFVMNAGVTAGNGALGGIRLTNKTEGIFVSNGDILRGEFSMTTTGTWTIGQRPAYNNFTAVFFDTSTQGVQLDKMIETEFVGCWFSGGRVAPGYSGLYLVQTDSIKLTNCRFFNCGSNGFLASANANNTMLVNCSANSNAQTAAGQGFRFENSLNWSMTNCIANNSLYTGSQSYGVYVSASCDNFTIRDCKLSGNATGSINDLSASSAVKFISGNIGYTTQAKGSSAVVIGQTVIAINHGLPFTPAAEDFAIVPTTLMSAAGITSWRVTSVGASQFQVQTNTAVAGANFSFGWQVRSKGA